MPTVKIKYKPGHALEPIIDGLAAYLPEIVAPQMNVPGRKLHDGGVGEKEVMIDPEEYSTFARNVNDIEITVVAHPYKERRARLDESTREIKKGVMDILRDFDRNVRVGVSVWLVEMGYETI